MAVGCIQKEGIAAEETPLPTSSITPLAAIEITHTPVPEATPKQFDYYNHIPSQESVNHTLIIKFPIVKSPMSYYVYNESAINNYKYNLTLKNIRTAFDKWENATKGRVKFVQSASAPENGIIIRLVTNLSGDTIGEAAPYGTMLENYILITGGEMELEPTYGGSENLVQIVHEIGHIMGLGHVTNSHSVMYPWNAYSQVITPDIEKAMDVLYKGVPQSD